MCATAPNCVCVRMCMCTCAVFSVDYNDELDVLVSGSADFSVKVWALSAGACLNTLTGHTEWVTKVRILWVFVCFCGSLCETYFHYFNYWQEITNLNVFCLLLF